MLTVDRACIIDRKRPGTTLRSGNIISLLDESIGSHVFEALLTAMSPVVFVAARESCEMDPAEEVEDDSSIGFRGKH